MKSRVLAVSIAALLCGAGAVLACGPDLPWAAFTHRAHPDAPLAGYASGQLGLVQPTWARSYLVVAYRWFSGTPLVAAEQAAAVRTWTERARPWWSEEKKAGLPDWMAAREKVAGMPTAPKELREAMTAGAWEYTFGAGPDAFRLATRTLEERVASEGARSAAVRAWAAAQDTVFAISAGGDYRLAETAQARTDTDRLYQFAAVAFHAGRWADAEARFRVLSLAPWSRHKALARYLAVRCVVRAAQSDDEDGALDRDAFARAEGELRDMLDDPSSAELHPALRRLLGFVAFRLRPVPRFGELSRNLRTVDATFGQDLWDFSLMLDVVAGADDAPQAIGASRDALVVAANGDELADWVLTIQKGAAAGNRAYLRWKAQRSLPWLVAALAAAQPDSRETPELLEAAATVPPMSPAFVTVSSHRARLLAPRGEAPAARRVLDAALARPALPVGSRNALLAQRASLATTFDQLLADLPRAPVDVIYGTDVLVEPTPATPADWEPDSSYKVQRERVMALRRRAECFDEDGAMAFNAGLPLAYWQRALGEPALPARLRREVALAGWTRAVLLADSAAAAGFALQARTLEPSLAADLAAWEKAPRRAEREFAAALLVARRAGMQPFVNDGLDRLTPFDQLDDYRENWWSSRSTARGAESEWFTVGEAATGAATRSALEAARLVPAFLAPAERAALRDELARLSRAEGAPNWLGPRILAFAKAKPRDPRVPEALHRLVRAVRLGASDARSAAYAKEAFTLLHRRYPGSPWAKRTKSWGT
ncbi:MAG: hypothetical protein U0704_10890 [Candidatus Eisenbacteria bacterium]